MKELLKLSDHELMQNERVRKAYWGLVGNPPKRHFILKDRPMGNILLARYRCEYCGKRGPYGDLRVDNCDGLHPIQVSIYQAAFEMRDACVDIGLDRFRDALYRVRNEIHVDGESYWMAHKSQPKHWIIAAVLCYDAKSE